MVSRSGVHLVRSEARRKALQILYQAQITGLSTAEIISSELYVSELGLPCGFTCLLLEGISDHINKIDKMIASTSQHWTIGRMPLVDLNILRLAVFEMLYLDDVPQSVAINEAVELAKCFGGEDDSSRFVNGVLGRIAILLESPEHREPGDDPDALAPVGLPGQSEVSVQPGKTGAAQQVEQVQQAGEAQPDERAQQAGEAQQYEQAQQAGCLQRSLDFELRSGD